MAFGGLLGSYAVLLRGDIECRSSRRPVMSIVGGVDIHRKQLTFDYVERETGRWERGRVAPADREHLAKWLVRFDGVGDVQFAMEGCTGWRYVAEEMRAAGVIAHLAEPADTAALRGRKRRAKTDRADSRHLRQLLADGRLPECYIPPYAVLEWRGCWSGGRCWSCITTCARSTPGGRSASRPPVSIRAAPHPGRPG